MRFRRLTAIVALSMSLAACSTSGSSPVTAPASAAQGPAGASGATIEMAGSASLGAILTGANGLTLYTHAGDGPTSSTCTADCATAWPPLTVPAGAQPVAGARVTGSLGTLARADGTTQVTYDGAPLYYWQGDAKAGDVTGNGVNGFSVATVSGAGPSPSSAGKPGY